MVLYFKRLPALSNPGLYLSILFVNYAGNSPFYEEIFSLYPLLFQHNFRFCPKRKKAV